MAWIVVWMAALATVVIAWRPRSEELSYWKRQLDAFRSDLSKSAVAKIVLLGAIATLALSFSIGFLAAPSNWDSLTYHLARVAYFAQYGSLDDYGANFWAQEGQARISAILLGSIMAPLGMSDRLHFLPQWVSLFVIMVVVVSLAHRAGVSRVGSVVGAAVCGLFTNAAMESATAQNDLVIAGFFAAGLLGWLNFRRSGQIEMLLLGAIGPALALGTKASALTVVPAFFLVAGVGLFPRWTRPDVSGCRRFLALMGVGVGFAVLMALPAGYLKNYHRFGDWLGPIEIRQEHLYHEVGILDRIRFGSLNALRFAFDATSFHGVPVMIGSEVEETIKETLGEWVTDAGVDLSSSSGVRARTSFEFYRPRFAEENYAWFGLLGPLMLFPAVVWALFRGSPLVRACAVGALVYSVGQCFAGQYDPWRGRQFIYILPFAGPVVGAFCDTQSRLRSVWCKGILIAGAIAGLCAGSLRYFSPVIPRGGTPAFWQLDRLGQMTVRVEQAAAIREFDQTVGKNAVVALALPAGSLEYVYFGHRAGRLLVPVGGRLPVDTWTGSVDWLLFDRRMEVPVQPEDVDLGHDLSLRRISASAIRP